MRFFSFLSFLIILTASDAGASEKLNESKFFAEIPVGEKFEIILDSNRTTGYVWQLAAPLDDSRVRHTVSTYQPSQDDRMGAGGKETWVFETLAPGKIKIHFKYVRPWEKRTLPAKTLTFSIEIFKSSETSPSTGLPSKPPI